MTLALVASLSTEITPSAHAAPGESDTFLNLDGTARYATIASNSALGAAYYPGGGGGGTGFDDSVTGADQPGGSGGSGVIVLRYLSTLTATFTGVTTATYRQSSSISVTTSLASKVTFLANGKRIAGCISLLTNSSLVATCSWRPTIRGNITLTATVTPLLPGVSAQSKTVIANVARRSGSR